MSRRRKIVIISAAAVFCGLLFTVFILPVIARNQIEKQITIATDCSWREGGVRCSGQIALYLTGS